MLLTLDLAQLFPSEFAEFGECRVKFVPMSALEKDVSSVKEVSGIVMVKEPISDSAPC